MLHFSEKNTKFCTSCPLSLYYFLMKQIMTRTMHAPEIYGDFWFNSEPVAMQSLQGQVVLLVFWDFTSAQSLRAVCVAEDFYRRYAEMGLIVIGIHSSEFSFAKERRRVEDAVHRLNIHFPIATDNTQMLLDAYRVEEMPTMFLIDRENLLYAIHTGEVGYEHLERSIQALLRDAGYRGELPPLFSIAQKRADFPSVLIPAMQTGYLHGALGNVEGYSPELPAQYTDPGMYVDGKFYAQGIWRAGKNSFEYCGEENGGYIAFSFYGGDVNAVIGADQSAEGVQQNTIVCLRLDGASMPADKIGSNVMIDGNGKSFVEIDEPKLVSLVRGNDLLKHTLRIIPTTYGTTLYSISFDAPSGLAESERRQEKFQNN